jgi:hypothetical protein
MQWILNGPAVPLLTTDPVSVSFFNGKTVFLVGRNGGAAAAPPGWNVRATRIFTRFADLQKAFASGRIGPDVKAILYDSEGWRFTPEREQQHFAEYSSRVAELVHAHGLLFINAPAVTLTRAYATGPGEKRYDAYIRLNIAADGARHADVFEIQAQGSVTNAARFASFVRAAADQARAANRDVGVLAGLSTSPNGQQVSVAQLVAAVRATESFVDGYWLNVPAASPYCPLSVFAPENAIHLLGDI